MPLIITLKQFQYYFAPFMIKSHFVFRIIKYLTFYICWYQWHRYSRSVSRTEFKFSLDNILYMVGIGNEHKLSYLAINSLEFRFKLETSLVNTLSRRCPLTDSETGASLCGVQEGERPLFCRPLECCSTRLEPTQMPPSIVCLCHFHPCTVRFVSLPRSLTAHIYCQRHIHTIYKQTVHTHVEKQPMRKCAQHLED